MIAHAHAKYMRVSSRKVRQVIELIRGKDVSTALAVLNQLGKGSCERIEKLLKSAVSNAKEKGLDEGQLYISRIISEVGPSWKRFRAAPFGRANPILKRTSHLTIELDLLNLSRPAQQNLKTQSEPLAHPTALARKKKTLALAK